ncbi:MAG TPA: HPP family protein [Ktedonobacteraceae bacterium]|nr:HPP family protein [Ktedonobacteraceae bacterium]
MQKHTPARRKTDITPRRTFLSYAQLPWLMQKYPRVPVLALYNFLSGFVSIGLMAVFAVILHSPFIFPSLGPTAFHYFSRQTASTASPRNAITGHAIGIVAGYFSLVVTGLTTAGPAIANGVTWPRVIAAALSLGLTAGLMLLTLQAIAINRFFGMPLPLWSQPAVPAKSVDGSDKD